MTSNSPTPASASPESAPAASSFKTPSLTLEAAAFVTIILGLMFLFVRNCPAPPTQRRRKAEPEKEFHNQRATEFMISESQTF
jgi:hypothetical protein